MRYIEDIGINKKSFPSEKEGTRANGYPHVSINYNISSG